MSRFIDKVGYITEIIERKVQELAINVSIFPPSRLISGFSEGLFGWRRIFRILTLIG